MTSTDEHIAIVREVQTAKGDPDKQRAILSRVPGGPEGWIASAYVELRKELVLGRLAEAELLSALIGQILSLQEDDPDEELAASRLHREAMALIMEGIRAILALDDISGIARLEQITEAVYAERALQWVAWYWISAAAINQGDLELAGRAAMNAMVLARKLDSHAMGLILCRLGEIAAKRGHHDDALENLAEAYRSFGGIGDARGMAIASLSRAKIFMDLGCEEEGIDAAATAYEADPDWETSVLFISQWLVKRGMLEEAEAELCTLDHLSPRSQEVERQRHLLECIRAGIVPVEVAAEYLRLREELPTVSVVRQLEALWKEYPSFVQLRELLAWTLVKTGGELEAVWHFNAMADMDLSTEIQNSVLLGLGCLANRQSKRRQPGARVLAAAAAVPERVAAPDGGAEDGEKSGEEQHTKKLEEVLAVLEASFGTESEAAEAPGERRPRREAVKRATSFAPKAAFSGDLELFSVPDLLDFLYSSRRTGTLVVTSKKGIGAVSLSAGKITGAATPRSSNVGQQLRQQDVLTEEQLQRVVERQSSDRPGQLLGSLLLEEGLVEIATLKEILTSQIKDALHEMMTWIHGRFAFEPDLIRETEIPEEIDLELDTRMLLLDVLREIDEQNR